MSMNRAPFEGASRFPNYASRVARWQVGGGVHAEATMSLRDATSRQAHRLPIDG